MNLFDVRVLKFIKTKHRVNNTVLYKKFGTECRLVLGLLEKEGYIESPPLNDGVHFGFTTGDDWKITELGLYFLKNYKAEQRLTTKQKLFNFILGFISGVLTGCTVQYLSQILFS